MGSNRQLGKGVCKDIKNKADDGFGRDINYLNMPNNNQRRIFFQISYPSNNPTYSLRMSRTKRDDINIICAEIGTKRSVSEITNSHKVSFYEVDAENFFHHYTNVTRDNSLIEVVLTNSFGGNKLFNHYLTSESELEGCLDTQLINISRDDHTSGGLTIGSLLGVSKDYTVDGESEDTKSDEFYEANVERFLLKEAFERLLDTKYEDLFYKIREPTDYEEIIDMVLMNNSNLAYNSKRFRPIIFSRN